MTQQRADYPINQATHGDDNKDPLRDIADATTDQIKRAAGNAQDFVDKVGDQARVYGDKAREAAEQVKPFVDKSLKEQPMATLAAAAVIGFVLGALWKK